VSAAVKRTFPSVPRDNRDWTRFLQGLFFAREWTTTLQGCVTDPTGVVYYTVAAGIVCLKIPQLIAVSDSTLCFLSNLPSEITPARDQYCLARIVDNGVTAMGIVHIGVDTGITLYADIDDGPFTAAGDKGIKSCAITYPLD
jgi:hypothetical protein